ncbi:MAG: hypothetical protein K0Q69_3396, partial [Devosia sp.]|nr:hypothetical protein [Devosia sp.]
PPRKVGGDCNNQLASPLLQGPVVRAEKGITEKGIK